MLYSAAMKVTSLLLGALFAGIVCLPAIGGAVEIVPFRTFNQSPVIQVFRLPALGASKVLEKGRKEASLVFDLANNYADDVSGSESITLDGETSRLNFAGRMGLGNGLEIGVELPWVFQRGGFLDGFIDDYHRTFGFSRGGRDKAPKDRLLFRYSRNGRDLLRIEDSSSGIGDVRLTAGFQLYRRDDERPRSLALRMALKLPTGDSDELHGSGSTDAGLWVSGSQGWRTGSGLWEVFAGGGILGMTEGDVLPDQQRNAVFFGSLGAGWNPLPWLVLKVQFDGQTPFYKDSDLKELDSNSVQVITGGSLRLSERSALEIGVSEDLTVGTSPDVVFHFALSHAF